MCASQAAGAGNRPIQTTPAGLIADQAVATVYTVRLTVTARVALVGAKLHRAVAWVRLHEPDHHRPRAHRATGSRHGCKPLIRSHVMPFRRKRRYFDQALGNACGVTSQYGAAWSLPSERRHPCDCAESARSGPSAEPSARGRPAKSRVQRVPVGFWSEACPIA
jgi:hypothetical protein